MPSMSHEVLVELFKNRPSLAVELLKEAFGVEVPPYEEATVTAQNLTEIRPPEYRADLVIKLLHKGKPVWIVIVEVQLTIDPAKRFAWPVYIAVDREVYQCPTLLLVVAPDPDVAAWCEEPIKLGVPEFVLKPPVLRGDRIPKVTDPMAAMRRPELALLSAMAYGDSDEVVDIGRAALEGFSTLDEKLAAFYTDILYNAINEAARRVLEVKMKGYVWTSPWARELIQRGRDEGLKDGVKLGRDEGVKLGRDEGLKLAARSLSTVLRARGIDVPEQARQRILAEQDIGVIERWLERAVTAVTLADVFNEPN